jgi:hypothetical protein
MPDAYLFIPNVGDADDPFRLVQSTDEEVITATLKSERAIAIAMTIPLFLCNLARSLSALNWIGTVANRTLTLNSNITFYRITLCLQVLEWMFLILAVPGSYVIELMKRKRGDRTLWCRRYRVDEEMTNWVRTFTTFIFCNVCVAGGIVK